MDNEFGDFVVVGGLVYQPFYKLLIRLQFSGVAGVCTVEELDSLLNTPEFASSEFLNSTIIFIPGLNGFIKKITNEKMVNKYYINIPESMFLSVVK